jgi:hypothetical protein
MRSGRLPFAIGVAFVSLLTAPLDVFAQAWVPEQGDGTVSIAVQELNVKKHLAGTTLTDSGHINTLVLLTDLSYGLTDSLAVDVALPVVASQYTGPKPHPNTDIDNGQYHSTATDFRVAVRYNISRKGAVFTPYIGSIVPSHSYAFYGHSAPGLRLNELQVGTFVAKLFTSGVPGLFVSGRVGYGFVEKVMDISHNRSMGDLEVGYFITPALRAFGTTSAQYTHGGIDFPVEGLVAVPLQYKEVHDIIQQVNYVQLGGGFAYSVSDAVDLFGSFSREVAGRNGHVLNRGITLGASWGFSGRSKGKASASRSGIPTAEDARMTARHEGSLGRCICQKSGS